VSVRTSVTVGVASPVANDVTMTIAGLLRYGDWRHVATGCTAVVCRMHCCRLSDDVISQRAWPKHCAFACARPVESGSCFPTDALTCTLFSFSGTEQIGTYTVNTVAVIAVSLHFDYTTVRRLRRQSLYNFP